MNDIQDEIRKETILRAPRSRVWRMIVDPAQFGLWLHVRFPFAAFEPGMVAVGVCTVPQFADMRWEMVVDRVEPEHHFSYLWHPFAVDASVDYSGEEKTRVVFTLEEVENGKATRLTVVESGFSRVPAARRAKAYEMNGKGWSTVLDSIGTSVHADLHGSS
jgi:uncharacterized protein YndB with AHSA1/START domain